MEIILAVALFGLFATALIGLLMNSYGSDFQAEEVYKSSLYSQEGLEAVWSIRRQAWNFLVNGDYGLTKANGYWEFSGSSELIDDKYTRIITIADACRDGSKNLVDCPAGTIDLYTKKATVTVTYTSINNIENQVELIAYLTLWQSKDWIQTDWSGGSGQSIWSSSNRYSSDDGNINVSTSGQIALEGLAGGGCGSKIWTFDNVADYNLSDPAKIEIADGFAQLIGSGGDYNLADTITDSLEFDTADGYEPDIINISGNIYAVVYRGTGSDGFVKTFSIDSAGSISNATIDSLEFDTANGYEPNIINISNNIYAVAYRGTGSDGFVKTFSIDSAGAISNSTIDSLEFDTANGYEPNIINVSGTIYAVVYRGTGSDGFVKTFSIDSAGAISNSTIDSLEFDTANGYEPSIVKVSGTLYAIAYQRPNPGYLILLNIQDSGDIASAISDSIIFDNTLGDRPDLILVNSEFLAVAYTGSGNDGFIATVKIEQLASYPTDSPSVDPVLPYSTANIDAWSSFTEVAVKNGGEIYYQLSDDNGSTWYYWNGSDWGIAGPSSYNTASEINTNIASFPITAGQIEFKAFLTSNGTQQVQLDEVRISCAQYYDWPFDQATDYTYNPAEIEVTGGVAQLAGAGACGGTPTACNTYSSQSACEGQDGCSWGSGASGFTLNPSFDTDSSSWTYADWQNGARVNGDWQASGGNPNGYIRIVINGQRGRTISGYWRQSFVTTAANPAGTVSFDWRMPSYVATGLTSYYLYVFVDTVNGAPTLANYVWRSPLITGTTNWVTVSNLDISSRLGAAGTYYLKVAARGVYNNTSGPGTTIGAFDNVLLNWTGAGSCSGTPTACNTYTDEPSCTTQSGCNWSGSYPTSSNIQPAGIYNTPNIQEYTVFTETAVPNGGTIYYKLSDGTNWYWYNGTWQATTENASNDWNLAADINNNILSFSTSTGQIKFKAFLIGDGTEQIQLSNVRIGWGEMAGASGYAPFGYLISSAFDMTVPAAPNIISWVQNISACTPSCQVKLQIRTAPDAGGTPGTWTNWYGELGAGTYFTDPAGTIISPDLNFNRWIQYRAELTGDGSNTPILEEVKINYLP